jgi:hypothetical protein
MSKYPSLPHLAAPDRAQDEPAAEGLVAGGDRLKLIQKPKGSGQRCRRRPASRLGLSLWETFSFDHTAVAGPV